MKQLFKTRILQSGGVVKYQESQTPKGTFVAERVFGSSKNKDKVDPLTNIYQNPKSEFGKKLETAYQASLAKAQSGDFTGLNVGTNGIVTFELDSKKYRLGSLSDKPVAKDKPVEEKPIEEEIKDTPVKEEVKDKPKETKDFDPYKITLEWENDNYGNYGFTSSDKKYTDYSEAKKDAIELVSTRYDHSKLPKALQPMAIDWDFNTAFDSRVLLINSYLKQNDLPELDQPTRHSLYKDENELDKQWKTYLPKIKETYEKDPHDFLKTFWDTKSKYYSSIFVNTDKYKTNPQARGKNFQGRTQLEEWEDRNNLILNNSMKMLKSKKQLGGILKTNKMVNHKKLFKKGGVLKFQKGSTGNQTVITNFDSKYDYMIDDNTGAYKARKKGETDWSMDLTNNELAKQRLDKFAQKVQVTNDDGSTGIGYEYKWTPDVVNRYSEDRDASKWERNQNDLNEIKEFQKEFTGLEIDGILGKNTLDSYKRAKDISPNGLLMDNIVEKKQGTFKPKTKEKAFSLMEENINNGELKGESWREQITPLIKLWRESATDEELQKVKQESKKIKDLGGGYWGDREGSEWDDAGIIAFVDKDFENVLKKFEEKRDKIYKQKQAKREFYKDPNGVRFTKSFVTPETRKQQKATSSFLDAMNGKFQFKKGGVLNQGKNNKEFVIEKTNLNHTLDGYSLVNGKLKKNLEDSVAGFLKPAKDTKGMKQVGKSLFTKLRVGGILK